MNNIRTFSLKRTAQAPLQFSGEYLAYAETSVDRAHPDYSGRPGGSEAIELYRRDDNKLIVLVHEITLWDGADDVWTVTVCDTADEVRMVLSGIRVRIIDELIEESELENIDDE